MLPKSFNSKSIFLGSSGTRVRLSVSKSIICSRALTFLESSFRTLSRLVKSGIWASTLLLSCLKKINSTYFIESAPGFTLPIEEEFDRLFDLACLNPERHRELLALDSPPTRLVFIENSIETFTARLEQTKVYLEQNVPIPSAFVSQRQVSCFLGQLFVNAEQTDVLWVVPSLNRFKAAAIAFVTQVNLSNNEPVIRSAGPFLDAIDRLLRALDQAQAQYP